MPLVIYVPGVLNTTRQVDWITSHIDIAPSVLELLGISKDRELEQGLSMWDRRVRERVTFFFARNYLGADGFYDNGRVFMLRYLFGGVFARTWLGRLGFGGEDAVKDPVLEEEVRSRIAEMNALQRRWARMMIPGDSHLVFGRDERSR